MTFSVSVNDCHILSRLEGQQASVRTNGVHQIRGHHTCMYIYIHCNYIDIDIDVDTYIEGQYTCNLRKYLLV